MIDKAPFQAERFYESQAAQAKRMSSDITLNCEIISNQEAEKNSSLPLSLLGQNVILIMLLWYILQKEPRYLLAFSDGKISLISAKNFLK